MEAAGSGGKRVSKEEARGALSQRETQFEHLINS